MKVEIKQSSIAQPALLPPPVLNHEQIGKLIEETASCITKTVSKLHSCQELKVKIDFLAVISPQ